MFVVLVVGVVVARGQRCERAGRAPCDEEAANAQAVSTFLTEMLSSVDPGKLKERDVTVRQVLDEAAKRVATLIADEPEIEASVRNTLGMTYRSLCLYSEAEMNPRGSRGAAQGLRGDDPAVPRA